MPDPSWSGQKRIRVERLKSSLQLSHWGGYRISQRVPLPPGAAARRSKFMLQNWSFLGFCSIIFYEKRSKSLEISQKRPKFTVFGSFLG
jgi:hypothetical protein